MGIVLQTLQRRGTASGRAEQALQLSRRWASVGGSTLTKHCPSPATRPVRTLRRRPAAYRLPLGLHQPLVCWCGGGGPGRLVVASEALGGSGGRLA
jgi:hypothetical protein